MYKIELLYLGFLPRFLNNPENFNLSDNITITKTIFFVAIHVLIGTIPHKHVKYLN
jgi:hypothetical protein